MPAGRDIKRSTRNTLPGFGAAVRAEREWQGLTGVELAAAAGCSPAAVSDIEREARSVSLELAVRLARALDVPLTDLLPDPA